MATFRPKLPLIDEFLTTAPPTALTEISNVASKAMRFKVLLDRKTRGFEQVDRNGPPGAYEFGKTSVVKFNKVEGYKNESKFLLGYTSEKPGTKKETKVNENTVDKIFIIDMDSSGPSTTSIKGKKSLSNSYDYRVLPFVPGGLSYSPSSKFVGIATLGRNNPYYQFTGSEDTLTFEIDWFSSQLDRKDVINNCRWIEALTKADAYDSPPHRVLLGWGTDNLLWKDDLWICVSAPYSLSEFVRGYRKVKAYKEPDANGEFISTNLLPQQAMQKVTFKKITNTNLTHEQIRKVI